MARRVADRCTLLRVSSLTRTVVRIVSLGSATALVCAPLATSPMGNAAADRGAAPTATANQQQVHERRELKLRGRMGRAERNKLIAHTMMARYGWRNSRQFRCLERLWARESRWNERAHNASTGAYGIPQALPGTKMASAGSDWRTDPRTQVRWGLRYIKNRYGSPCSAWNHLQASGWY